MRVRRKGAQCVVEVVTYQNSFLSLSKFSKISKDSKKNSCYCASLPSSYIPIFPPPPLTLLNYITINQNSELTSFTHSFRIIYTNILISLCSSFLYVPPPTPPPRLAGISWNFRQYGTQRNGVSSK